MKRRDFNSKSGWPNWVRFLSFSTLYPYAHHYSTDLGQQGYHMHVCFFSVLLNRLLHLYFSLMVWLYNLYFPTCLWLHNWILCPKLLSLRHTNTIALPDSDFMVVNRWHWWHRDPSSRSSQYPAWIHLKQLPLFLSSWNLNDDCSTFVIYSNSN